MNEENTSSDFEVQENTENNKNEPKNEAAPEELAPKKRITRRTLGTKKAVEKPSSPAKKTGDKFEINEVLSNLYGEAGGTGNVQEITMKENSIFYRVLYILSLGIIFAGTVWAGFLFFPQKNSSTSQVELSVSGPKQLNLGATTTYTISYENKSNTHLNNVILNAYFPEGFVFLESDPKPDNPGHNEWNLSSLVAYQRGEIKITGLTYGSINDQKSWRVFLNYYPENFNSELQTAATLTTVISTSPVKLTISGPDKASLGNDVTYNYSIQKNLSWKGQLYIMPVVPANFSITSSSPALDKKTGQWILPSSSSTKPAPKTFTLTGKYISSPEEPSPIKGTVLIPASAGQNYEIANGQITTELLKNDVSVSLAINGTVTDFASKPGDLLNMTIRVKNQSPNDIIDVVPKIILSAPSDKKISLLKFSDLVDKNENVIVGEQIDDFTRRGTISWTKTEVPLLAKIKAGGEITFDVQLPIKNSKEYKLEAIKSPLITAVSEVKFKDASKATQTVGTKPITITLNSDLTFSTENNVDNPGSDNTKHTVTWVLNNNFHALKNIQITATTFGDVNFTLLDKGAGNLVYDQDEDKITWSITEMPEGTDVFNCSFSLVLQKKNPTQSLLLSKAHLTATDSVTGETIDLAGEEISLLQ